MTTPKTHEVSVLYLLPLRLSVGFSFLFAGGNKISMGNWGAAYESSLFEFVTSNLEFAYHFYRPFLESVVIPNTTNFALLVAWGEFLTGVSIFFGLFTRLGAVVGIFLVLNYTFAVGRGILMPSLEFAYMWALFTLMICSAGRRAGVDQILRSRKRIRFFT
jgi:uncharacterized membrane protein YphA (DoxX/SURF4 family)